MIDFTVTGLPALDSPIWYEQDRGKVYRQLFESGRHDKRVDDENFCYLYDYELCKQVLIDQQKFTPDGERVLLNMTEGNGSFSSGLLSFRVDSQARSIRQDLRVALDDNTLVGNLSDGRLAPIKALTESADIVRQINGFDLALNLSLEFMSSILGIPDELQSLYTAWALSPENKSVDVLLMQKLNSSISLGHCKGVAKSLKDRGWENQQISVAIKLLSHASLRTVQRSITNLFYVITRHPDLFSNLKEEMFDSFITETLRLYPPTVALARTAKIDCELQSDLAIRENTHVVVIIGAAQRDPARYDDPDRFDLHRNAKELLAFGWGPHSCLGERIARSVLGAVLKYLRRNNVKLRLASDPTPMRSFSFATWTNLPLIADSSKKGIQHERIKN
ncbi:cytochrome P450 [Bifidobacterium sp. ESL0784]|uniref:cytochrome P450 n=1 Tax=Bifidobacterium sp. ESL0784 TaxID=2983231 RepID=UPI0023F872AF|nr:cytochrome P450 [Bifidobacterium sp. ESL0784]MDF7640109.1 cytochrome P450 [Bifidobacterium sp. ESL0784]